MSLSRFLPTDPSLALMLGRRFAVILNRWWAGISIREYKGTTRYHHRNDSSYLVPLLKMYFAYKVVNVSTNSFILFCRFRFVELYPIIIFNFNFCTGFN